MRMRWLLRRFNPFSGHHIQETRRSVTIVGTSIKTDSAVKIDSAALLLEVLRSASQPSGFAETLSASQVNRIGNSLGLTNTQLLQLLTWLSKSGDVELQWGGNVKVIRPKQTTPSIHIERGGTFVQNAEIGAGAAVGSNAMAAGAVRISGARQQDQLDAIAKLTAAITLMSDSLSQLEGETRRQVENAVEETQEILPELRNDQPDKSYLTPRLEKVDKVLGVLAKITTIGSATLPGLPQAVGLMHQGLAAALRLLGGS
jgi:hypothetical protein